MELISNLFDAIPVIVKDISLIAVTLAGLFKTVRHIKTRKLR